MKSEYYVPAIIQIKGEIDLDLLVAKRFDALMNEQKKKCNKTCDQCPDFMYCGDKLIPTKDAYLEKIKGEVRGRPIVVTSGVNIEMESRIHGITSYTKEAPNEHGDIFSIPHTSNVTTSHLVGYKSLISLMVQREDASLVLAETGDYGSRLTNLAETLVNSAIKLNQPIILRGELNKDQNYLNLHLLVTLGFGIIFDKYSRPGLMI